MSLIIKKIVLFVLLTSAVSSEVLEVQFVDFYTDRALVAGDANILTIQIGPLRDKTFLESLKGEVASGLFLASVEEITPSINEKDFFELRGLFVLTNDFTPGELVEVEKKGIKVLWQMPNVDFRAGEVDDLEFEFIDQGFLRDKKFLLPFLVFFASGFVLSLFAGNYYKVKRKKLLEERNKNYWMSKLLKAKTRKDFESLTSSYYEWSKFVPDTAFNKEFIDLVKGIQYKKDWTEAEHAQVIEKHEKVKKIISR